MTPKISTPFSTSGIKEIILYRNLSIRDHNMRGANLNSIDVFKGMAMFREGEVITV